MGRDLPAALSEPACGPFVDMAVEHARPGARTLLGTYRACGDLDQLSATVAAAGPVVVDTRSQLGTASFDSAEALAAT